MAIKTYEVDVIGLAYYYVRTKVSVDIPPGLSTADERVLVETAIREADVQNEIPWKGIPDDQGDTIIANYKEVKS